MTVDLDTIASLSTACGIGVAAYQLRQTRQGLRDNFERAFVDRYQAITGGLTLDTILGLGLVPNDDTTRRTLYTYLELCEEELYYRARRRVSRATWRDWWYGIRANLAKPGFSQAVDEWVISQTAGPVDSFVLLRAALAHLSSPEYDPPRLKR